MSEYLDIINEKDEVIGKETYEFVHTNNLKHRISDLLIFKDDSLEDLLLQKRSPNKKYYPDVLCIIGGHVDSGESDIDAANRELKEELFYKIKMPKFNLEYMFNYNMLDEYNNEFHKYFKVIYPGPFSLDLSEGTDYKFYNIDFLKKDVKENPEKYIWTFPHVLDLLEKYKLKK